MRVIDNSGGARDGLAGATPHSPVLLCYPLNFALIRENAFLVVSRPHDHRRLKRNLMQGVAAILQSEQGEGKFLRTTPFKSLEKASAALVKLIKKS